MQAHPTPTAVPRPAPSPAPDVQARDLRESELDRKARAACASRLVIVLNLPREHARLAANDIIDEYLSLTGRGRC